MPAALEHVQRANQVTVGVGVRVLDRVAHAGLSGEVHHALQPGAREQRFHALPIGEVELLEGEPLVAAENLQPGLFSVGS